MDAERIARNDATFRHANEQIERAAERADIELVPFLCECADERCTEIVRLTLADYEAVRGDPRWFLNVPGHEQGSQPHVRVVDDRGDYLVVEKLGEAGEIVEDLDERTSAGG
jgi:hypothetical protein